MSQPFDVRRKLVLDAIDVLQNELLAVRQYEDFTPNARTSANRTLEVMRELRTRIEGQTFPA